MVIQLSFTAQRKVIRFKVVGRMVIYYDENWKDGLQIFPLDKEKVKLMLRHRSPRISAYGLLIMDANTGRNLEEYNDCKTEEELAGLIRRDCASKGIVEIK